MKAYYGAHLFLLYKARRGGDL